MLEHGAALVGPADMSGLPEEIRRGFPRAVSIAVALDPRIVAGIAQGPTLEYREHYRARNALLDELSALAAERLESSGHRALALAATNRTGEPVKLAHKTAATLAGLGWIGKCALLVTPEFGSAVRLATVLTDAPLPPGGPTRRSLCAECRACVEVCPGNAPRGVNWTQGMRREEIFDVEACRRGVRKISSERGLDVLICGRCIANCPRTQAYLRRAADPPAPT
ncbi:MAG: epoxyqueuosine reductase [Planctomycetota bacterium]